MCSYQEIHESLELSPQLLTLVALEINHTSVYNLTLCPAAFRPSNLTDAVGTFLKFAKE